MEQEHYRSLVLRYPGTGGRHCLVRKGDSHDEVKRLVTSRVLVYGRSGWSGFAA